MKSNKNKDDKEPKIEETEPLSAEDEIQKLKEEVEGKIAILKGAIEANNLPEMQTSMTDLNDALQRLGQAVYSQASDAGMPPDMTMEDVTVSDDSEATDPPSDDTIEGEFREVQ